MTRDRSGAWQTLWDERGARMGQTHPGGTVLGHLVAADGYDGGLGYISAPAWAAWVDRAASLLDLQPHHRLLDAGCGTGPLLWSVRGRAALVIGVDYAERMLRIGRAHVPEALLAAGEIASLPFADGVFDRVICTGVLMYLASHEHGRRAIQELLRVCASGGRVLIADVPDLATRDEAEQARAAANDRTHYRSDPALTHLYYPRSLFQEVVAAAGARVDLHDQEIPGYGNSPYRFNAVLHLP